jgi:hypothetical protein
MNQIEEIFKSNELDERAISQQISYKIQNLQIDEILNKFCYFQNDTVFLDYVYFKYFSCQDTYSIIIQYLTNVLDGVLQHFSLFTIHINMSTLSINEINTHHSFICGISALLKKKYPNKLAKCFIHNAPNVFSKIYSIISLFIDTQTQLKIELIK